VRTDDPNVRSRGHPSVPTCVAPERRAQSRSGMGMPLAASAEPARSVLEGNKRSAIVFRSGRRMSRRRISTAATNGHFNRSPPTRTLNTPNAHKVRISPLRPFASGVSCLIGVSPGGVCRRHLSPGKSLPLPIRVILFRVAPVVLSGEQSRPAVLDPRMGRHLQTVSKAAPT